ncbi:MAG TPA: ABC transporter ATP-binding protein [Gemmatimonadaceae bacterium]|nr:ABC transporter ATP-binding protein [Gemmatimonadaceae bacterium]
MIQVRSLWKKFGALDVLRGLELAVGRGRVTAIVGPNGAGKTTLLKTILGLTRPDAGEVVVDGVRVNGDESYRSQIGYMPQLARFPGNLTARELFAMLSDLRGVDPSIALDEELVTAFALEPELAKPIRTLSGGTRQKVNAAAAFLFRPRLLILDEPTAGLDPLSSGVLKAKVLAARDSGCTVVVTSHIMSDLEELADDVVFLSGGQAHYAGSVAELIELTRQVNLERAIAAMMLRGTRPAAA